MIRIHSSLLSQGNLDFRSLFYAFTKKTGSTHYPKIDYSVEQISKEEISQLESLGVLSGPMFSLTNSDCFKRLAGVSQLSLRHSEQEQGSRVSRFSHSIHAATVAHYWLDDMLADNFSFQDATYGNFDKATILKVAKWIMLLHDIAHLPFQHAGEEAMQITGRLFEQLDNRKYPELSEFDHDIRASEIIKKSETTARIRQDFQSGSTKIINLIEDVICEKNSDNPIVKFFTDIKNMCDRTSYLACDRACLTRTNIARQESPIGTITLDTEITITNIHTPNHVSGVSSCILHFTLDSTLDICGNALNSCFGSVVGGVPYLVTNNPNVMQDFVNLRAAHFKDLTFSPAGQICQAAIKRALILAFLLNKENPNLGLDINNFHTLSEDEIIQKLKIIFPNFLSTGPDKTISIHLKIPLKPEHLPKEVDLYTVIPSEAANVLPLEIGNPKKPEVDTIFITIINPGKAISVNVQQKSPTDPIKQLCITPTEHPFLQKDLSSSENPYTPYLSIKFAEPFQIGSGRNYVKDKETILKTIINIIQNLKTLGIQVDCDSITISDMGRGILKED